MLVIPWKHICSLGDYQLCLSRSHIFDPTSKSRFDEQTHLCSVGEFSEFQCIQHIRMFCVGIFKWPGDASKRSQLILMGFSILRIALLPILIFSNIAPGNRITMVNYKNEYYIFEISNFLVHEAFS